MRINMTTVSRNSLIVIKNGISHQIVFNLNEILSKKLKMLALLIDRNKWILREAVRGRLHKGTNLTRRERLEIAVEKHVITPIGVELLVSQTYY